MKTKKQVKKIFGDGGKVSKEKEVKPYQAKDQKDYEYRSKMYNDSLNLHNSAAAVRKYLDDNPTGTTTTSKKGDIDIDAINPYKNGAKKTKYKDITVYEYDKPKQKVLPPGKKSELKQKEVKKSEQVKQDIPKSKKDTIAPNRPYGQMIGSKGTVDEKGKVTWDRPATAKEKAEAKKTPKMGNGGKVTKKKKK